MKYLYMLEQKTGMGPLVSVIVPVYRAEMWIRQCVDSLLGQSYRNIELILVDDGSPDSSGAICDEYAATDSRVKVIHQPNGGVGIARQTGMNNATGKYVIHADPDDWVEQTMIEELVAKAIEEDADMVICDYYEEHKDANQYCHLELEPTPEAAFIERLLITHKLSGYLWNKMIRRKCCDGVDFPDDITLLEDELFIIRALHVGNIRRVTYLPKAFYHYRTYNPSSIIHVKSERNLRSQVKVLEYLIDITGGDCFIDRKKWIIYDLFLLKRFTEINERYPEMHRRLIDEQRRWHIGRPMQSAISLALRGYPRLAYNMYKVNKAILDLKYMMALKLRNILDITK